MGNLQLEGGDLEQAKGLLLLLTDLVFFYLGEESVVCLKEASLVSQQSCSIFASQNWVLRKRK
jgi:hypothetical protein